MENLIQWLTTAQDMLATFGINALVALAIFIIGQWIAKIIGRTAKKVMTHRGVDPTLINFTTSLIYYSALAFVVIAALNRLGIQTASLVAVLGAAGLAIGLALQGSLSNFAAGVLIIIFRPFNVGDMIEGAGVFGRVDAIQLFTTTIITPDNATVVVPNTKLSNDNITNFTTQPTRRVETIVGISYSDSIEKARLAILDELSKDARVLKDPAPAVNVAALADSSVELRIWPWTENGDFLPVRLALPELIKTRLDAEGITIPFPQRDVHTFQHN
ncbi:MAG: mechanosensitive ion channel domain-containing protein [Leptolyngbya sp.]|nr:mechanosensitive ion channel domain-containing protein [Leptolyngbya sp.]